MKTSLKIKAFAFGLLSLALTSGSISAQTGSIGSEEGDKTSLEKNVFGIGVNVSLMSGSGIAFKEHFARSPWSYMLAGYVIKDNSGTAYNYGAELQYDFYMKEATRFYGIVGASYYYTGGVPQGYYDYGSGTYVGGGGAERNILRGPTRFGAGIGFEIAISSAVGFYTNVSLTSFQPSGDLLILPYGGFMIYFR